MNIESLNAYSFQENEEKAEIEKEKEKSNEAEAQPVEGGQVKKQKISIDYENLKYKAKVLIIEDSKESSTKDIEIYNKTKSVGWVGKGLISLKGTIIFRPLYLYQHFENYNEVYELRKLFKLRYNNFDEVISDTVIKFFYKEIIKILDKFTKKNLPSYGVALYKTLKNINYPIKISDYATLKKYLINITKNKTNINQFDEITEDQDYFNLACSLFLLKYGIPIFKYADKIIKKSALMENINYIKNKRLPYKEFFSFIDNLINNALENKYSFEQIKRNKFWYKNYEYIEKIVYDYDNDEKNVIFLTKIQTTSHDNDNVEEKLKFLAELPNQNTNDDDKVKFLTELQKQDFLMEKKEIFENNYKRELNDINMNKQKKRNTRKNFKFKKNLIKISGKITN